MQSYSHLIIAALAPLVILTQGCAATHPSPTAVGVDNDARSYSGPPTTAAITAGDLRTRLYVFADDSMRGRAAGTVDNLRGTAYIEREVRRLGLEPGGDGGTFFQRVPLVAKGISSASAVTIDGKRFALFTDFMPRDNGAGTRPIDATAVYGGSLPDMANLIDPSAVTGKIVIFSMAYGYLFNRIALTARYPTAAAISIATLDRVPTTTIKNFREPSIDLKETTTVAPRAVPEFFYASSELAKAMFGGATPATLPVGKTGRRIQGRIAFDSDAAPARNVIAILRGSDPSLREEYVALGAHNDHIPVIPAVDHDSVRAFNVVVRPQGAESPQPAVTPEQRSRIREVLDSLRRLRPPRPDSINNGADDDGTGSMAVLEIAEAFAKAQVKPKRSIIFVWHTGEELGLYGSSWFTDHPTVTRDSIVTQLNIDMVGRGAATDVVNFKNDRPVYGGPTYVEVIGSRRLSTELGDLIDDVNRKEPTPLSFDYDFDANGEEHQMYCRSDHYMYARYGIPIAFFFTGVHRDYHQVTDEPQYIDYPHYARIVNLVRDIADRVANLDHRPVVNKPKPDPHRSCKQ